MENCSTICFLLFKSLLNLKIKRGHPHLSLGHQEALSEVALQTRESLKRLHFTLPLSILVGTNLIMLSFFFSTPVWFPTKSTLHSISWKIHVCLISEKIHAKPPRKTRKIVFFASCVFWICSRGCFAFVPFDLNFTNPKSTIF